MKEVKNSNEKNFTKLTKKTGISLIVLIVTIIVIIILAATVILTINKNNPVVSSREARFKEDLKAMQDDLSMYISKIYAENISTFNATTLNLEGSSMVSVLPSTEKYKDKVKVEDGKLVYIGDNKSEKKWARSILGSYIPKEWKDKIVEVTEDDVPIPKGFTYVTGTKETGTVIKDEKGNEFVWIPATQDTYIKDFSFSSHYTATINNTSDDTLPSGITDELADVKKYGGFYIGRYEAGIPEGDTTPSNKVGVPVSKQGATVWTDITYKNAKASAESMISNDYVQSGLLTGKAWDRTCHYIEDSVSSLTNSKTYGNYANSMEPANVTGHGSKQVAGYSDKWSVKNIYDLAGNVEEWTTELVSSYYHILRGGRISRR